MSARPTKAHCEITGCSAPVIRRMRVVRDGVTEHDLEICAEHSKRLTDAGVPDRAPLETKS